MESRVDRQEWCARFVVDTWGERNMYPQERAKRLFEEAAELAQTEGLTRDELVAVIDHVYAKPAGTPSREAGGVGVCLLGYCQSVGLSADATERAEIERLQSLDPEHFRRRHQVKVDAGVAQQGIRPGEGES